MKRLLLGDVKHNWRSWAALGLLFASIAATASFSMAVIDSGLRKYDAIDGVAIVMASVTALVSIIIISSVTSLFSRQQAKDFALWQIIGVQPKQISRIIKGQTVIIALPFGLLGSMTMGSLLNDAYSASWGSDLNLSNTPAVHISAAIFVTFVAWLGTLRTARNSGKLSPLLFLRDPEAQQNKMSKARWIIAGIISFLIFFLLQSLLNDIGAAQIYTPVTYLLAALTGVLVVMSPIIFPVVLRAWTSMVPRNFSPPWTLARAQALEKITTSHAILTPFLIVISLIGGFYSISYIFRNVSETQNLANGMEIIPFAQMLSLFSGVIIPSLAGSTIAIFISNRARLKELAILEVAGFSQGQIVKTALAEVLIYTVTAAILGIIPIVGTVAITIMSYSTSGISTPFFIDAATILIIGLFGFLLILAAVLPSILKAMKKPLVPALS